jgi:hypothetical protein
MKQNSDKIFLVKDSKTKLGSCQNFFEILKFSKSKYVMFCDQDDFWIKDKIKITLEKMNELEKIHGAHRPILLHTDLTVVNDNLQKIAKSFWKFAHLNPKDGKKLSRILVQNVVTGCTAMINRTLKNLAPTVPDDALSHDWWLALVACAFGKIESIPIPTVLYRQHEENVYGAKKWNHFTFLLNTFRTLLYKNIFTVIIEEKYQTKMIQKKLYNQANAFYDYYFEKLDKQQSLLLYNFFKMEANNFIHRRIKFLKYCYFRPGIGRNLRLFFYI